MAFLEMFPSLCFLNFILLIQLAQNIISLPVGKKRTQGKKEGEEEEKVFAVYSFFHSPFPDYFFADCNTTRILSGGLKY